MAPRAALSLHGVHACFRRKAGALRGGCAGVHPAAQFDKVRSLSSRRPTSFDEIDKKLTADAGRLLNALGCRTDDCCADRGLGFASGERPYDIEGVACSDRRTTAEIASCRNTTLAFQARPREHSSFPPRHGQGGSTCTR